ncbi:hypothetical protein CLIM01_03013 [Colletotrichum limetticola]|uniref:Signal peptide-containing protein n=1 Tax=Colletotrichum limetticola TaxID=1209924 RepID=A0ABQ9Q750_9PEZI|nr:hypothetical protein CLIM01_03013 [Colletotrichum limetticola]
MSLPVAIQSAIFYYLACTPCNEMKAFRKAKKKAKEDREVKRKIEMEQPGLYRHPDPFHTNPFWAEEMAAGPHLPKKSTNKNSSQRGLASAGRTSTVASFGGASTVAESTSPATPTISASTAGRKLSGEGWNRELYQREDEELWGHNFTGMGHKLMDNIAKAGNTAGRYMEEKLGLEKPITDEDRENFYRTPRNPPVNEYHPPIVGSKPSRPDALKWMLQPPPPAKLMEGRIPVARTQSTSTVGSRRTMASEDTPLDRLVREKALKKKLRQQGEKLPLEETPSESELIDSLIGRRSRRTTVSSRGMSNRSRSLSLDSEVSSDGELVERRRIARARRVPMTPEETSSDEDDFVQHRTWDSLGKSSPPRRPKLETIKSSRSNSRQALKARPNGTKPDVASKDNSDVTPKASTNPIINRTADENTPTTITATTTVS